MTQHPVQGDVNAVWDSVWQESRGSAKAILSHRLFVEGSRIMMPLVSPQSRRVLEIGTGSGRYAVALQRRVPDAQVIATDIVTSSLSGARALFDEVGLSQIETAAADVEALPYPDRSFDVVFADVVIQHVPDDAQAVREMARVLAPGGILIVSGVNRWSLHALVRLMQRMFGRSYRYGIERLYDQSKLKRLFVSAGLTVTTVTGFYPAYGIYRLKHVSPVFAVLGKGLNRVTRVLDAIGLPISRWFGFELVVAGRKS